MHRYYGIDFLRGVAAFFIVGCHIALLDRTPVAKWATHFCDTNVGLFAAISGFLFAAGIHSLTYDSWKDYALKRVRRLLPIYLVWSLLYLTVRLLTAILIRSGSIVEITRDPFFLLKFIFAGGGACHLWFLIDLLYVQIFLILAWRFIPRLFNNSLVLGAISVLSLVSSVMFSGDLFFYFARLLSFVSLGILVHRMTLHKTKCSDSPIRLFLILAIVVAVTAHMAFNTMLPRFIRDYILVFPILSWGVIVKIPPNKVFDFLSKTSMGVFLWHPLFAVGCALVVTHLVPAPYPSWAIMLDWTLVYILALGATVLTFALRLKKWVM